MALSTRAEDNESNASTDGHLLHPEGFFNTSLLNTLTKDNIYQPLHHEQTRLFTIHHGTNSFGQRTLDVRLHVCSLANPRPYIAISYTWQDESLTPAVEGKQMDFVVTCHGTSHAYLKRLAPMISVLVEGISYAEPANAHNSAETINGKSVLDEQPYGYDGGKLYYWLDAVCINQSDSVERGRQVAFMGKIYAQAISVDVYLGSAQILPNDCNRSPRDGILDPDMKNLVSRGSKSKDWVVGRHITNHVYWTRSWIIQELVGAKAIRFVLENGTSTDWLDFTHWFLHVRSGRHDVSIMDQDTTRQHQLILDIIWMCLRSSKPTLLRVLDETRFSKATDPRDSLYSKLALGLDGLAIIPEPSYRDCVATVFRDFVRAYILHTDSLYIICLASPTALSSPSWVPDWSQPTGRCPLLRNFSSWAPEYYYLQSRGRGTLSASPRT